MANIKVRSIRFFEVQFNEEEAKALHEAIQLPESDDQGADPVDQHPQLEDLRALLAKHFGPKDPAKSAPGRKSNAQKAAEEAAQLAAGVMQQPPTPETTTPALGQEEGNTPAKAHAAHNATPHPAESKPGGRVNLTPKKETASQPA